MAISEKTRKILWGRSGNLCAVCRRELVIDATTVDDDSVVGDECHIISAKDQGPRHDATFPPYRIDDLENLILLCRVHHKMIDDQPETYTVEVLQKLKGNHEKWVSSTLAKVDQIRPVRIRRIKENIPRHLIRLATGQDVTRIVGDCQAFSFDHDEPKSEAEVSLLAGFLQEAKDLGELWSGLEAGYRVESGYRMGAMVQELQEAGFWVFGAQEIQQLEGGVGAPTLITVALLRVVRTTNSGIITLDPQSTQMATEQFPIPKNTSPDVSESAQPGCTNA